MDPEIGKEERGDKEDLRRGEEPSVLVSPPKRPGKVDRCQVRLQTSAPYTV